MINILIESIAITLKGKYPGIPPRARLSFIESDIADFYEEVNVDDYSIL
jgi:hypothetical protein